jgi:hypothetical protein
MLTWIMFAALWLTRAVLLAVVVLSAMLLRDLFKSPNGVLDRGAIVALLLVGTVALLASFSANPMVRKFVGGIGAMFTLALFGWFLSNGFLVAIMAGI